MLDGHIGMGVASTTSSNPACDTTGGNAVPGTRQPREVLLRVGCQAAHIPLALPLKRGARARTMENDPPQRTGFCRAADATAIARFAPGGFRRCRCIENPADLIRILHEHRQRDCMRHLGSDQAPARQGGSGCIRRCRAQSGGEMERLVGRRLAGTIRGTTGLYGSTVVTVARGVVELDDQDYAIPQ